MRKIHTIFANKIIVHNIQGYFEKIVTRFGTGAKVDVPKEHLGKKVVILVFKN